MSLLAKISTQTDARGARLAGIGLMLLSVLLFSVGDATGKFIVATYSVGQLLCLRACAALLLLSPILKPRLKAVARMAMSTVAKPATARGWARLTCRARPSRREKKMMFIARAPGPLRSDYRSPWGQLWVATQVTSKLCTWLASSSSAP